METVKRLRTNYEQQSPRLSYGGNEGQQVTGKSYLTRPNEEEFKPLGVNAIKVWHATFPATADALPIEGYCVVDACLDATGRLTPNALPLWPEMEGHELSICIYVDACDRILMRAIGGFTTRKTKAAIRSA